MKILYKFPVRDRKDKMFQVMDIYLAHITDLANSQFLITCDNDDPILNTQEVRDQVSKLPNTSIEFYDNKNKIAAVNEGIKEKEFDILFLMSDDMIPLVKGFDNILRDLMKRNFPDIDGVVWTNDGHQAHRLNTLCILGRKYYDRFGYIYHPDYISLYADVEFMMVHVMLKKYIYTDQVLVEHQHHSFGKCKRDALYNRNETFESADKAMYLERKKKNFDLNAGDIK